MHYPLSLSVVSAEMQKRALFKRPCFRSRQNSGAGCVAGQWLVMAFGSGCGPPPLVRAHKLDLLHFYCPLLLVQIKISFGGRIFLDWNCVLAARWCWPRRSKKRKTLFGSNFIGFEYFIEMRLRLQINNKRCDWLQVKYLAAWWIVYALQSTFTKIPLFYSLYQLTTAMHIKTW